ncbi:MAG: hypothetical protein ACR2IF_14810 [Terriglobales bacterium]
MKLTITTLTLALGMMLLPPPRVTVNNPKILYALAMYKTAVGDTGAALRLMQRAEASKTNASHPEPPAASAASSTASARASIPSIISVATWGSTL